MKNEVINKDIYYDPHDLETFNSLFNFSIGERGKGKTYSLAKKRPIERFLKYGEQFIYLRRYKNELVTIGKFFDDIKHEFPDNKLEVKGRTFYCDGNVMGFAFELSKGNMQKSTAFPLVQTIVYDEFILEKGFIRYLPNEVEDFLNFYETVARLRPNVKVYFLGNAISLMNPYFIYWKIMPHTDRRFTKVSRTSREGNKGRHLIVVEILQDEYLYDNDGNRIESFREVKANTDFGELVKGTGYGERANENVFSDDNKDFIEKKTDNAKFMFTVHFRGRNYGIWIDVVVGKWFVSFKRDSNTKKSYAVTTEDFSPNMFLVDNIRLHNGLNNMIRAFKGGYLMFENGQIKSEMYDMIKMIG